MVKMINFCNCESNCFLGSNLSNLASAVQPLAIYFVCWSGISARKDFCSFGITDFLRVGLLECQLVVVQFAQHLWLKKPDNNTV